MQSGMRSSGSKWKGNPREKGREENGRGYPNSALERDAETVDYEDYH